MKILIDIQHPANFLLFNNFAKEMEKKGNSVLFTARAKEVTISLIRSANMSYVSFGKNYKNIIGKIFGLIKFDILLFKIAIKFKPDIFISHGSIYAAHVSFILNKPNISVNAVDNDVLLRFCRPFTSIYLTSKSFKKYLGDNHIYYDGYHELAYLHPNYFKPDKAVLETLNIGDNEKYILLRFVSWNAYDDIGMNGINDDYKRKIVKTFLSFGKIFISSEDPLPVDLKKYEIKIQPNQMQDAEYFALLLFGDSGSMSSECAMLGTPAIYLSSKSHGFIDELSNKYNLISTFTDPDLALKETISLLNKEKLKLTYHKRCQKMLANKIDVTAFMVWFIENYPDSVKIMKENPDYQFKFK